MKKFFGMLAVCGFALALAPVAGADWSDNFDSYSVGGLNGLGGWECWDANPAYNAYIVTSPNRSAPNSLQITPTTDITQQFSETSGSWVITAWQYIPTGSTGNQYFILLNTYTTGGPYDWSLQIEFNATTTQFTITDPGTYVGTILYNQWVEIKDEINLTTGMQSIYYNGTLCETIPWQLTGVNELNAMDLFSDGGSNIYYDDISLVAVTALDQQTWAEIKSNL
jgi:hypothetical protein